MSNTNGVNIGKQYTINELVDAMDELVSAQQKRLMESPVMYKAYWGGAVPNKTLPVVVKPLFTPRLMVDHTFNGMKIYIVQDVPKMQLSARVCEVLAPDFIAETNAWMAEFFGWTNIADDGEYLVDTINDAVHMNKRTFEQFKRLTLQLDQ